MDMEVEIEIDDDFDSSQSLISKKPKQDNKDVLETDTEMSNNALVSTSTSDLSYQEDTNDDLVDENDDGDDFGMDDDDVPFDYGDDDDDDDDVVDDDDDDEYLKLQAQFDNVDLPPGVEASVSWLPEPSPIEEKPSATGPSTSHQEDKCSGASSSKTESSLKIIKEETMYEVLRKLMYFKQFDTVADCSDHHYIDTKSAERQPSKSWAKKVQDEWKILEHNLPDM